MGVAVVLPVTGCPTLANHSQSCTPSRGMMGPSEFTCSGTAGTVKGEEIITFDGAGDPDPDYRMALTASVETGPMDVCASTADGGREGGEVSPGNPIRIQAGVPSSDEGVGANLGLKGISGTRRPLPGPSRRESARGLVGWRKGRSRTNMAGCSRSASRGEDDQDREPRGPRGRRVPRERRGLLTTPVRPPRPVRRSPPGGRGEGEGAS